MHVCVAVYVISEGREEEAIELFRKLSAATRTEPGNRAYHVHRSIDNPRRLLLYEQYHDRAAFEAHCKADYFDEYVVRGIRTMIQHRESQAYELII